MVGPNCKEKRMREDEILEQLTQFFMDNRGKIKVTDELQKTVNHYKDLAKYSLLIKGVKDNKISDPLGEYANFIFKHGSSERRTN